MLLEGFMLSLEEESFLIVKKKRESDGSSLQQGHI